MMKKVIFPSFLFLLPFFASAQVINCKVTEVLDGNTLKCETQRQMQLTITLQQIAAPELKQSYGPHAKAFLASLVSDRKIKVMTKNSIKAKRIKGTVFSFGQDINLEMVRSGMARYTPKPAKSAEYQQAESLAKKTGQGQWSQKKASAL